MLTSEVVVLVVEDSLDSNDISSVCAVSPDGGHDGDQDMLLDREWTGVE